MFDIEECRITLLTEYTYEVAYLGGRMLLRYETEPPHGDEICQYISLSQTMNYPIGAT